MTQTPAPLTNARIFRFWSPLAATWLLMAVEGPLLAAVIARMADANVNLAAYGVAYAFGLLAEAPVIMLLGATTALCRSHASYLQLRRFALLISAAVTLLLVILVLPPVFTLLGETLLGLSPELAGQSRLALMALLPWPAAIGLRRFYQGVMIRTGQTHRVAVGTVTRMLGMAATGLGGAWLGIWPGATVGMLALSAGVTVEALVSRRLARPAIRRLRHEAGETETEAAAAALDLRAIWRYYLPLALTPFIGLSVQPLVTFFLSHGVAPLESLAALPVVCGITFVFRALGLSYQEAAIALVGDRFEGRARAGKFALVLAAVCTILLGVIALTPCADFWLQSLAGLTPELADISRLPLILMVPLPALTVWLTWQRSLLVLARETGAVSTATAVELVAVALVMALLIKWVPLAGITLAAVAMLAGRLLGIVYLIPRCRAVVRRCEEAG